MPVISLCLSNRERSCDALSYYLKRIPVRSICTHQVDSKIFFSITILKYLQVTAVLAKVAIRAASGLDLPVSDFLNGAKSYLGEEMADRVLNDSVIERALDGTSRPEEGQVKTLVGEAYEKLKKFMEEQKSKGTGQYVHFDKLMQPVDDGEGGKVWVSNDNVELWKEACAKKAHP